VLLPSIVLTMFSSIKLIEIINFSNVIRKKDAVIEVTEKSGIYKAFD